MFVCTFVDNVNFSAVIQDKWLIFVKIPHTNEHMIYLFWRSGDKTLNIIFVLSLISYSLATIACYHLCLIIFLFFVKIVFGSEVGFILSRHMKENS